MKVPLVNVPVELLISTTYCVKCHLLFNMNMVSISSVGSPLVLVLEREKSQQQPPLLGPDMILLTPVTLPFTSLWRWGQNCPGLKVEPTGDLHGDRLTASGLYTSGLYSFPDNS